MRSRTSTRTRAARQRSVDPALHASRPGHAEALKSEANGHTPDRGEGDAGALEARVEAVHKRQNEHDGEGVEVREQVVGHAVCLHVARLGYGVG